MDVLALRSQIKKFQDFKFVVLFLYTFLPTSKIVLLVLFYVFANQAKQKIKKHKECMDAKKDEELASVLNSWHII